MTDDLSKRENKIDDIIPHQNDLNKGLTGSFVPANPKPTEAKPTVIKPLIEKK